MLDRVSVSVFLKSVIAALGAAVILMLALGAWDSWVRLTAASRIVAATDASAHMFTALHNLRVDRTRTARHMFADEAAKEMDKSLREGRAALMPALKSALIALQAVDFPEQAAAVAELEPKIKRLAALHEETAAALLKPKAARRAGLAQEHRDETSRLIETLDRVSLRLNELVKLDDAFIDQLMQLKQFGWVARNAAGEAQSMISNMLEGQPAPPNALLNYTTHIATLNAAWGALQSIAAGLALPARFVDAVQSAKQVYFAGNEMQRRMEILKALIAGQPPGITVAEWSPQAVPKLATLLNVAEVALDVARDHATRQRSAAMWRVWVQVGLLAAAVLFTTGMILMVSRRVTGPLRLIQDAMLKVAAGDLSAEVSFGHRRDEIGALGNAMQAFKGSMVEAERLRAEQKDSEVRAAAQRKADMQRLADDFQAAVGNIVDAVSTSSGELEKAASTLTRNAETTQKLSVAVASASEEASANVQSVASATEEMTGSVQEIARQVAESSRIAGEAVKQAEQTDARITELSSAASRIGDVVKLITAIAEQTNLLALNATIEAARAGEAGRGFAVVAQEVKALAAQTAKATDEIGTQIASMQSATQDSVGAIKEISGTIGRISEIATAITAAVDEQGATTDEIARNVQQAAHGTTQVAANIADVNRGTSETGSASSQVLGSAQSLSRESHQLKREVEKFVAMVRAA